MSKKKPNTDILQEAEEKSNRGKIEAQAKKERQIELVRKKGIHVERRVITNCELFSNAKTKYQEKLLKYRIQKHDYELNNAK